MTYEQTISAFEPISSVLSADLSKIHSFWSAIIRAKGLGWLKFRNDDGLVDEEDDTGIDTEEYFHYARLFPSEL
jgi:hypothetical protein